MSLILSFMFCIEFVNVRNRLEVGSRLTQGRLEAGSREARERLETVSISNQSITQCICPHARIVDTTHVEYEETRCAQHGKDICNYVCSHACAR